MDRRKLDRVLGAETTAIEQDLSARRLMHAVYQAQQGGLCLIHCGPG